MYYCITVSIVPFVLFPIANKNYFVFRLKNEKPFLQFTQIVKDKTRQDKILLTSTLFFLFFCFVFIFRPTPIPTLTPTIYIYTSSIPINFKILFPFRFFSFLFISFLFLSYYNYNPPTFYYF